MLYLIGGPPRCGKTTLGSALAKKHRIPYFSIDHITSVIPPYISAERQDESFPLRALRQQVNNDNDRFFERYSSEEIVNVYLKQSETCWPGIRNFINYAIEDEHQLILEGWQILPHLLQEVPSAKRMDKVQVKYLYKTDVRQIVAGLKANKAENDWVLKNTKEEISFTRIAQMISHFGQRINEEASRYGFEAVNMDVGFARKISDLCGDTPEPTSSGN